MACPPCFQTLNQCTGTAVLPTGLTRHSSVWLLLCCAVLCWAGLGCAGLCWAVLGWAGLGWAVLCCAVLCCAVLCCACCALLLAHKIRTKMQTGCRLLLSSIRALSQDNMHACIHKFMQPGLQRSESDQHDAFCSAICPLQVSICRKRSQGSLSLSKLSWQLTVSGVFCLSQSPVAVLTAYPESLMLVSYW